MKSTQLLLLAFALPAMAFPHAVAAHDDHGSVVFMRDDCDPRDPAWQPTGGCALKEGDVTLAEFNAELVSPLSTSVIGHQAWRNDPSYTEIEEGDTLVVRNRGGRTHTFTHVVHFGGGRVPPLSVGLVPAPECSSAINVPAGGRVRIRDLDVGLHHFQCCIHPWMRAVVRVKPREKDD